MLVKEWKLIARDPQMIAQTFLQLLYLLPLALLWMRGEPAGRAVAPAVVLLAEMLASALTWLTVAAEDAPELVATAPVPGGLLRRAKLAAGVLPVWVLMLPLLVPLARADATAALVFAVCVVGATLSAGSIHIALARTGRRGDLRRRGQGDPATGVFGPDDDLRLAGADLVLALGASVRAASGSARAGDAARCLAMGPAAASAQRRRLRRRRLPHRDADARASIRVAAD